MRKARVVYLVLACLLLIGSAASCMTIGEAKSANNGTDGHIVGCVTYVEPGECYIESIDKSAGIRIQGIPGNPAIGDTLSIRGIKQSASNGEAVIAAYGVSNAGTASIQPFTMANKWIGGADAFILDRKKISVPPGVAPQYLWKSTGGANNTGLLIKTTGKVTAVYSTPATASAPAGKWFYIDDGSDIVSDLGDIGVLVISDAEVKIGDFVSVTGVSTIDQALDTPQRMVRTIITPNATSVKILKRPEPKYPMSDEFDGSVLNPMWMPYVAPNSSISLTDNPGTLTMSVQPIQDPLSQFSVMLMLPSPGDWDMELKMHPIFIESVNRHYGIDLLLYNQHSMKPIMQPETYHPLVSLMPSYNNGIGMPDSEVSFPNESNIYISFKKRGSSVDVRVTDGTLNYSPSINPVNFTPPGTCLYIIGHTDFTSSFTATIDYVRFTRVTE